MTSSPDVVGPGSPDTVTYPALTPALACSCHGDGATCPRCRRRILVGEPYALDLIGATEDTLRADLVCVYCAGKPRPPFRAPV